MREQVVNQQEGDTLASFARGEREAFAGVMKEYQAMVYSLALHFLGDPSLAEDMAQEVFLQLYQNRASIKSVTHLRSWIRKVTCHRSMDCVRRKRRHRVVSLEDAPEPSVTDVTGDLLLQEKLWRLLGSLPEKSRMVLILRYQEDLAYREISDVMEIPVNTVKSSLERGLALLKRKLTRSFGGMIP